MSASATAAGYLFASGRLSKGKDKRATKMQQEVDNEKHYPDVQKTPVYENPKPSSKPARIEYKKKRTYSR